MVKYGFILLFLLLIIVTSCNRESYDYEDFTFWGEYDGNGILKMDGYYLEVDTVYNKPNIYIFYNNGIYYSTICIQDDIENGYCGIEERRNKFNDWGVFIIEGDVIKIQYYHGTRGLFSKYKVKERSGTIIDSTTFILSFDNEEELYRFHKTDTKPDSTCILLDKLGTP